MGAVAEAVGGALGDVLDPIKKVGEIGESVVREVGHACESVGREVGKVGQAAIDDPVGTIAKVAAIATQQYWALPLISAATVMAHGGDLGSAALAAGISLAAQGVAFGISEGLSSAFANELTSSVGDAVLESSNTLVDGTIEHVFSDGSTILQGVDGAISTTPATVGASWASQLPAGVLQGGINAVANMGGSMAAKAISGGDINDVLMSGLTSGVGSAIGSTVAGGAKDFGVNNTVANVLGKATGAAAASTVAGKDAKLSFINALINTTLSEGGKQVNSALKSAWTSVNESATKFNEQLTKAQEDYKTTIAPLEQDATVAQEKAASSFDEYKVVKDKFDSVMAEYNAAKDAGDVEKANNLADQANALIPELNAATTKYNGDVEVFDTKLATFNSAADQYKTQTDAIAAAKIEYDARNADLQKSTAELTEAGLKVADMGDVAKTAFQKLYDDGNSVTTALDTVKTVEEMSDVAKNSFMRQYDQNKDPAASLEFAQKINGLAAPEQTAYSTAIDTGLDDASALKVAPTISALSEPSQRVYLDSLKSGQDERTATITATLAELFKDQSATTTESPYAPVASAPTGTVSDVGGPSTPLVPANTGKVTVSSPEEEFDANAPTLPIPSEEDINIDEPVAEDKGDSHEGLVWSETQGDWVPPGPNSGAMPQTGPYIPPVDGNVDNRDVGNGENQNPDYVAPQVPGETIGTPGGNGSVVDTLNKIGSKINIPTTGGTTGGGNTTTPAPTPTPTPTVKAPVVSTPATPWSLPSVSAPAVSTPYTGNLSGGTNTASNLLQQNTNSGIQNLTPGLTQRMDYSLTGIPNINETTSAIPNFATGGSAYDPFAAGSAGDSVNAGLYKSLSPGLTKAQINYILTGLPGANIQAHAEGGEIGPEGHNPTFFSEGGLNSMENRYVEGEGDGTSDSVAAMLANGEFVIPADVVAKLGNGSNEAGAGVLDQFLKVVRKDANSNGGELPPKSKGPLAYLLDAKRTMKA